MTTVPERRSSGLRSHLSTKGCGPPGVKSRITSDNSVTSAKTVLKVQINIRTKVLKCTGEHILFTIATVGELNEHLVKLTRAEMPSDHVTLRNIIRDQKTLTGLKVRHRWDDEGKCTHAYNGHIVEFMKDTNEFS